MVEVVAVGPIPRVCRQRRRSLLFVVLVAKEGVEAVRVGRDYGCWEAVAVVRVRGGGGGARRVAQRTGGDTAQCVVRVLHVECSGSVRGSALLLLDRMGAACTLDNRVCEDLSRRAFLIPGTNL